MKKPDHDFPWPGAIFIIMNGINSGNYPVKGVLWSANGAEIACGCVGAQLRNGLGNREGSLDWASLSLRPIVGSSGARLASISLARGIAYIHGVE